MLEPVTCKYEQLGQAQLPGQILRQKRQTDAQTAGISTARHTKQLQVIFRPAACTLGDASDPGGLLQQLDVIGVQLLLSHAVHHGHELLDAHLTLLI